MRLKSTPARNIQNGSGRRYSLCSEARSMSGCMVCCPECSAHIGTDLSIDVGTSTDVGTDLLIQRAVVGVGFGGSRSRRKRISRIKSEIVPLKLGLRIAHRHMSSKSSTISSNGGNLFRLYFNVFLAAIVLLVSVAGCPEV